LALKPENVALLSRS